MSATDLPDRRTMYLQGPPVVLSMAELDALDAADDREGIALVAAIHERKMATGGV